MIKKQHWCAALAIAFSLHVAAFVTLAANTENNTAKDDGEKGVEIDLGMLGDLGVEKIETEKKQAEKQQEIETEKEEIIEKAETEAEPEPTPIIKPIEVDKKPVIKEETVTVTKKTTPKKTAKKEPKFSESKVKPKNELVAKAVQSDASTTPTKAKQANSNAKKITTGTQNSLSTGGNKGAKQSYISVIAAKLARYKRYPNSSRKRGQEGTATLYFVIQRDGKVTESYISTSSGYKKLDQAVLRMLKKASPLPPFPKDMEQEQLTIRIPIEFKLNDKR